MKQKTDAPDDGKKFARRNRLLEIQKQAQKLWLESKTHESDVDPARPKYLVTFPYPYMNARLHLGHAFSCSKAEFTARFKRLKGYNVLFPFGFHVTGMPICAAAKKLEEELKSDGLEALIKLSASRKEHDPKFEKRKMTQFEILQSCYIPPEEIPKFVDPIHWVHYFPPHAVDDLKDIGFAIDFRRSFVTTDLNPYYDSFIRWQFNVLKERNFIKFGKRPTIFSEKEDQICADHERSVGEGVLPQEYTLIKIQLASFTSAPLAALHEKFPNHSFILPAATLRPETMYGQTNCYVLPEGEYGAFQVSDKEIWICSKRSMRNMAFQGLTAEPRKMVELGIVKGEALIG